jgi:hypothetical protein
MSKGEYLMAEFYRSMYGNGPKVVVTPKIEDEHQKRAVKVLGGMKVHNSHVKQVIIDDELIDVPKIEYVRLLEEQIRETRMRLGALEAKHTRLVNNYNKILGKLQEMSRSLSGKVDLR